jgi:hypothetical protein
VVLEVLMQAIRAELIWRANFATSNQARWERAIRTSPALKEAVESGGYEIKRNITSAYPSFYGLRYRI